MPGFRACAATPNASSDCADGVCVLPQTSLAFLALSVGSEISMEVTEKVVREVAALAQLRVKAGEMAGLAAGMKNILDLAEQMQSVETDGVEPVSNPLDATQVMRADEVTESDQRERFQAIAPETEGAHYLVPRVIE